MSEASEILIALTVGGTVRAAQTRSLAPIAPDGGGVASGGATEGSLLRCLHSFPSTICAI